MYNEYTSFDNILYIIRHIQEILAKANDTYIRRISESNVFFNKVCCDFKLLEKKCNEWDN